VKNAYKCFGWKTQGKTSLGRLRRRWEDNITMDVRVIGWEGVDWLHLAQTRDQWRAVVNTVMNLQNPQTAGNVLTT